jgi:hypothetical protein
VFRSARPRSWCSAAVAIGLAAALLAPAAVSADVGGGGGPGGATISFGSINVVGKLVANVTVNLTCDPLDTLDPNTYQPTTTTVGELNELGVQLLQAQGRTIDTGIGEASGGTLVCDSSTINKVVVQVVAQNSPWHNGGAVGSASVFIGEPFGIDVDGGSTGSVTVKLSAK